mmetsp:Transcript_29538/g.62746  ORF Transcript_29538/g.62746 Transcript_29538/m.62746 type:complete len:181 (+) Transcript_29538:184-726(+)|eukprot:CAMPEP_0197493222 /NCGR_PEP_ID=MMETSP1311-20131121/20267_1 /TAXON_ID=464262 /ORGANISM="Genus nov. species nov., Strain RCC856" /LENGTH=180 /DNA_ID=CAMNT_0043038427 /DNA_START=170 /DNA_END=712 /DNA_ORIENTATION=+
MLVKNLSGGLSSRRVVTRSNVTTTVAKATKGTAGSKGSRGVSMPLFNPNEKDFKQKKDASANAPKLLTRVQELRLLSKLEEAGLLSAAEKAGITLSTIENLELLTKAEDLGLVSAAVDRNTPGLVTFVSLLLFAAGPATVYLLPEDSATLVAVQALVAITCTLGGSALWGAAQFLGKLQK